MRIKRLFLLIPALLLMLSGCADASRAPADKTSEDRLSVVATIFAPYDFTRELAGGLADVTMLIPPAGESHTFEPTPRDIITIQECDVFIYVGGESDTWVKTVLDSMDTGRMRIVTLIDCVEAVPEELVEGMESHGHDGHDESGDHDDKDPELDEHVWTSPKNAKLIAQRISDALCESDEQNAGEYRQNTERFIEKLDELDNAFNAVIDGAVRKTIVFGDRFPFRYLTDAYGIEYFAAFPGCAAETEPSAKTVAFLIDKIKEEQIPVVFHAELANEGIANAISEATGARVMLLHACHSISSEDFIGGVSYLDLMGRNVEALREALW